MGEVWLLGALRDVQFFVHSIFYDLSGTNLRPQFSRQPTFFPLTFYPG